MPPLGLDSNDPREAQRQQLNKDISLNSTDYGAKAWVDLDQALRNPADVSKLAPTYLTGGGENNAYHDKIAQTMADAIKSLPPFSAL